MNHTKCPICGCEEIFYEEFQGNNSSGKATRVVSRIGGQSAAKVAGQVVGGVVGSYFGVGEQVAALGGSVAGYLAGNQIDKEFDKRKKPNKIICNCPSCSLRWNSKLHPQEVVRRVKSKKKEDDKVDFDWFGVITFLISAPIAGACWYLCDEFDSGFMWLLVRLALGVAGFFAIFGFIAIFTSAGNSSVFSNIKMAKKTRKMSLEEYVRFRNEYGLLDMDYDVEGRG